MLEEKEPTLKEIKEVVTKARTGSAPGPNGLMYKVYKKCPKLLVRLWKYESCLEKGCNSIMLANCRGDFCSERGKLQGAKPV